MRIFLVFLAAAACSKPSPVLVLLPPQMSDGGLLLRDLYRSFGSPPLTDEDDIRVGLLWRKNTLRFHLLDRSTIRAVGESMPWEVSSPGRVTWRVEALGLRRPAVMSFVASVEERMLSAGTAPDHRRTSIWAERGFPSARWLPPPRMDTALPERSSARWSLALAEPGTKSDAAATCRRARGFPDAACYVLARIEIPPVGRSRLVAEQGSFSREFEGLLEIVSPQVPVEILDSVVEELRPRAGRESYGPRLFVVPDPDGLLAFVQSTTLGDYLSGVVPSEIFPSAPEEALRAQAVIARTYVLRKIHAAFSDQPFLVCATTACQVYRGASFRQPLTTRAVRDTSDLVVVDGAGDLAETYYHSISGGHTEPKGVIWGPPSPQYLSGVPDTSSDKRWTPLVNDDLVRAYLDTPAFTYCGNTSLTRADRWRWSREFDRGDIGKLLSDLGLDPPLFHARVLRRGVSGRALTVEFLTARGARRINGEYEIRRRLGGLLSSLFVLDLRIEIGEVVGMTVRGGGYGHGVGLSQMGAIGRAEAGQDFRAILSAYYPGTTVRSLR